jgi:hypothetical protein
MDRIDIEIFLTNAMYYARIRKADAQRIVASQLRLTQRMFAFLRDAYKEEK